MKKAKRATATSSSFDAELRALLESVPPPMAQIAKRLVEWLITGHPDLTPTVRNGWRSVNFRHQKAGFVCGVFPLADHVLLVFEYGVCLITPPDCSKAITSSKCGSSISAREMPSRSTRSACC
jgi:hypothetical protein